MVVAVAAAVVAVAPFPDTPVQPVPEREVSPGMDVSVSADRIKSL